MQRTIYICDGCNEETDKKLLAIRLTFTEPNGGQKSAQVHVCSDKCIGTAVKKSYFVAEEEKTQTEAIGQTLNKYYFTDTISSNNLPQDALKLKDASTGGEIWGLRKYIQEAVKSTKSYKKAR